MKAINQHLFTLQCISRSDHYFIGCHAKLCEVNHLSDHTATG